MNAQQKNDSLMYSVDHQRGCTRYTLHIKGSAGFPPAVVTAAVIPDRVLGTYRVVVTAGSPQTRIVNTVHDLCVNNIPDEQRASGYARECVRAAEQFWRDCVEAQGGGDGA